MDRKGLEIERKFLVTSGAFKVAASRQYRITQVYVSSLPGRTVRVRIGGEKAFLTIKGIPDETGTTRYEWEKEIPLDDAGELMLLCEPGVIDKTRYLVEWGRFTFEVDVFHGENEGLVVAEIELSGSNDQFPIPDWLGKEVTGRSEYYNSALARHPYSKW